jgi:cysteine peptidase B
MRGLLSATAVLAASAVAEFPLDRLDRTSFQKWKSQYGRAYSTYEEEERRYSFYLANGARIVETAHANPLATFGLDDFADWSPEEFQQQRPLDGAPVWPDAAEQPFFSEDEVVAAQAAGPIDWVERGAVTTPTSQGRCGTCAQFSATANIEAQWHLAGHPLVKLSEQEMIDCSSYTGPYGMGWVSSIHKGLDLIKDYPLANHSDPTVKGCRSPCDTARANHSFAHIDGATCLPNSRTEAQMLAWLQHGPLSISVDAGPFGGYKGGIITANSTCSKHGVDHAVLIVGYGIANGVKYWKIKNSWGPAFGEGGYIRLLYNAFGENSTHGCLGLLGACQSYIGSPPVPLATSSVIV